MSARDKILAAKAHEEVVSGPAGDVLVRGMTIGAKDAVQGAVMAGASWRDIVLRRCCFEPGGGPLFGPDDDLGAVPVEYVEPYVDAALRLTAMSKAEIEELEGNSERTLSVATGSD